MKAKWTTALMEIAPNGANGQNGTIAQSPVAREARKENDNASDWENATGRGPRLSLALRGHVRHGTSGVRGGYVRPSAILVRGVGLGNVTGLVNVAGHWKTVKIATPKFALIGARGRNGVHVHSLAVRESAAGTDRVWERAAARD